MRLNRGPCRTRGRVRRLRPRARRRRLLVGSIIPAITICQNNLVPVGSLHKAQHPVGMFQGIQQVTHRRRGHRQWRASPALPGWLGALQAQIKLAMPGSQSLPRRGLQQLHLSVVVRRPMCSISCEPRLNEYTICTAVAPEGVFTVRAHPPPTAPKAPASTQMSDPTAASLQVSAMSQSFLTGVTAELAGRLFSH